MWFIVAGTLVVIVIAAFVVSRGRFYRRIFSEDSFREFHNALSLAIESAEAQGTSPEPSLEHGTAFRTEAGLAVSVTFESGDDGLHTLHTSLSQTGVRTTHAVASRFGFFTLAMLWSNKAELFPYFTQSGVHHMRFSFQSRDVTLQDFESSYSRYRHEYRPIPFQQE